MIPLLEIARGSLSLLSLDADSQPIILSSRVRLARNLTGIPLPWIATVPQKKVILERFIQLLETPEIFWYSERLVSEEKRFFCERHLAGREFLQSGEGSGLAMLAENQSLSVTLNAEDHFRLQCLTGGFSLQRAWNAVNGLERRFSAQLPFAFDARWGYLTCCPSNLGTAMRASVMLHLPGLVSSNRMLQVVHAANQVGCVVRGMNGEGSTPDGWLFQVSNQQTLGESEAQILTRLESLTAVICQVELEARAEIMKQQYSHLLDRLSRSLATLKSAFLMRASEAMILLGDVRWAVDSQFLPVAVRSLVDRLLVEIQPIHLQILAGAKMTENERNEYRARRLRESFSAVPNFSQIFSK